MSSFDGLPLSSHDLALVPSSLAKNSLPLGQLTALGNSANGAVSSTRGDVAIGGRTAARYVGPVWQVNPLESKVILPFTVAHSARENKDASSCSRSKPASNNHADDDDDDINWKTESARTAQQHTARAQAQKRLAGSYIPFETQDPGYRRHSPVHSVKEGVIQLPKSGGIKGRQQNVGRFKAGTKSSARGRRSGVASQQQQQQQLLLRQSSGTDTEEDDPDDDRVPIYQHAADSEFPTLMYDDGTYAPAMLPAISRPVPNTVRIHRHRILQKVTKGEIGKGGNQMDMKGEQQQQQQQLTPQLAPSSSRAAIDEQQHLLVKGKHRNFLHNNTTNRVVPVENHSIAAGSNSSSTPSEVPLPPPSLMKPHTKVFHVGCGGGTRDSLPLPDKYAPSVPVKNRTFLKKGSSTQAPHPPAVDFEMTGGSKNFGIGPTSLVSRSVVGNDRRGAKELSVSSETCGFKQAFLYRLGDLGRN